MWHSEEGQPGVAWRACHGFARGVSLFCGGLYFIPGPMGMWGMSFHCDELLLKKADLPHPLAAFKTSIPFNIVKNADEASLKRSFDALEEEISLDAKDAKEVANTVEVGAGASSSPLKKIRVDTE